MNQLNLPQGPASLAFRAFVDLLRSDPTLSSAVDRWIDYSGDREDDRVHEAGAAMPYVRLVPETVGYQRIALGDPPTAETIIQITIEVGCEGTNWDDSADLSAAIHDAIFSQDDAQRAANDAALSELGVIDVECITPPTSINDTETPFAVASGKYRITVWHAA